MAGKLLVIVAEACQGSSGQQVGTGFQNRGGGNYFHHCMRMTLPTQSGKAGITLGKYSNTCPEIMISLYCDKIPTSSPSS